MAAQVGHPLRLLVGKPGLDGHSNGAEQVAVRAKDAGFEVIYQGIRLTPEQIVASALEEDVDAIGLSIHSGSHMTLVPRITELLRQRGAGDVPVVVGGIIPDADRARLQHAGVARIYTPGESTLTADHRRHRRAHCRRARPRGRCGVTACRRADRLARVGGALLPQGEGVPQRTDGNVPHSCS